MIKILKHHAIDFGKYKKCLEDSCQNSDYADKYFLDVVSNRQWFLLVYGDYQAVMPVSYTKKLGFKIIIMPMICQQLGVFSKEDNASVNEKFYHFLQENFLVFYYAFNADNSFNKTVIKKTSYLIQKDRYENVKKNYSVHRRRNIRIIDDLVGNINIKKESSENATNFFIKNVKGTIKKQDNYSYHNIFTRLLQKNIGVMRILEFKNTIQSFVYLYEGKRNIYLSLFINNYPLANPNFPSIMIDHCLQEFIEEKNFDFMGSDVENVAKFNERFGAVSYQYPIIINTKITLIKNLLKKSRFITNFATSK